HNAALVEETNAAIEQTEGQAAELDRIVDVFVTTGSGSPTHAERPQTQSRPTQSPVRAEKPVTGIKALQQKVTTAAKSYLSKGNAAVATDEEWQEF
ncbi:MAG: hypothetical protein ACSHWX_04435, partial [Maritalea sp.]